MKFCLLLALAWVLGAGTAVAGDLAVITTPRGDIRIELYGDKAPKTVANFKKLAQEGFYQGLTFHRVVPGFVVQGGDPQGNGTGGPGYTLEAEIHPDLQHGTGAVATARLGDQVNPEKRSSGSQFYITLAPTPHLDGGYTIFGQVVDGMEVVRKIERGDKMEKIVIIEQP